MPVRIVVGEPPVPACAHGGRGPPARRHQGIGPSLPTKVPVGPSGPPVAIRTMIPPPSGRVFPVTPAARSCSTVGKPSRGPTKSVAVGPGDAELTRQRGKALAYWIVSMLSAAFDMGYASIDHRAAGPAFSVREP